MAYRNGEFPLDMFIQVGHEQYLWTGTYHRWAGFVADVQAECGVTPRITAGWNGYRPLSAQWWAYNNLPAGQAAYPGTSSHGGIFEGRDCGAIDVANRAQIGNERFVRLARKWGFQVDYFSWEPWHLIDRNPWVIPAWVNVTPIPTAVLDEGDGHMRYLFVKDQGGTANLWTAVNEATGDMVQIRDQANANSWSEAFGSAKVCSLQGFLDALKVIELTTANVATAEAQTAIRSALADIQAQIDANPAVAGDVIGPDDAGAVIRAE